MKTIKRWSAASVLLMVGLIGCKDLAGTQPLPAGTSSPGIVQNAAGAVQTAVAAEVIFQSAFASYIPVSGLLTDELQANARATAVSTGGVLSGTTSGLVGADARLLDQTADWYVRSTSAPQSSTDSVYVTLQLERGLAYQAIGGLAAYAPDSVALRGQLYALLGYTEVMLADLYCSGVPLSTLDFQGDYTYQPGSTTVQVYQHAIAMFDTALTLAASDARIVNLAKVGRGRAYLALGDYVSAGQAVSTVPTTFQFSDSVVTCGTSGNACTSQSAGSGNTRGNVIQNAHFALPGVFSVSDREAATGLPFVSSHDPRTADTMISATGPQYFPTKYHVTGASALMLASGLEAQLITAEVDLNAGNVSGAFVILNALRQQNAATMNLPPLVDPGTFGAEVDTLFTERAMWLFVDGHRQGDLRRLMRNYVNGQGVQVVANQYPSGDYGYGVGLYGLFIDAPVPASELANPHFTGCLSRD